MPLAFYIYNTAKTFYVTPLLPFSLTTIHSLHSSQFILNDAWNLSFLCFKYLMDSCCTSGKFQIAYPNLQNHSWSLPLCPHHLLLSLSLTMLQHVRPSFSPPNTDHLLVYLKSKLNLKKSHHYWPGSLNWDKHQKPSMWTEKQQMWVSSV